MKITVILTYKQAVLVIEQMEKGASVWEDQPIYSRMATRIAEKIDAAIKAERRTRG